MMPFFVLVLMHLHHKLYDTHKDPLSFSVCLSALVSNSVVRSHPGEHVVQKVLPFKSAAKVIDGA